IAVVDLAECCATSDRPTGAELWPTDPEVRIRLPAVRSQANHTWNQFTLRIRGAGQRDRLREFFSARAIGTEIYYPQPLHKQECFAALRSVTCPVATQLAQECLTIPIYPELEKEQRDYVIAAIRDWLKE